MDNNLNQSTINHYKERIEKMQVLYHQFEQNKAILAQHQSLWQQTAELVKTLQDFYWKDLFVFKNKGQLKK